VKAVVEISGEIYPNHTASRVGEQMAWEYVFANDKEETIDGITVLIDSIGGDVAEALLVTEVLNSYNLPITTHVIGNCCSAATIIQLMAEPKERYATANAKFLYHKARVPFLTDTTSDIAKEYATILTALDELFANIYMAGLGITEQEAYELMATDVVYSVDWAIGKGIVSSIKPYFIEEPTAMVARTSKVLTMYKSK